MSDTPGHPPVTELLVEARNGAEGAVERLFPLLYDELRRLAGAQLRLERVDHTLQPTALVHEAYLRLVDSSSLEPRDRAHFFAICARVMRRLLVDHHRQHRAGKRGGDRVRLTFDEGLVPGAASELDVLALDEVLGRLEALDPRKSRVVELRFFGGLGVDEVATALDVSRRTVEADWTFARAWLQRELTRD